MSAPRSLNALQVANAQLQHGQPILDRVGHVDVVQALRRCQALTRLSDDPPGDPNHGRIVRDISQHHAVRAEPLPSHEDGETFDESMLWIHQIAAESTSPSKRIELAEFREHLERAMGKLPPRIAQVFQLYSIEERPNQEVCEQLNISESNLWVMLHRARMALRRCLETNWFAKQEGAQ